MQDFTQHLFPGFGRQLLLGLVAAFAALGGLLLLNGAGALLPALVLGFAAAVLYARGTARRLWRLAGGGKVSARAMAISLLLRFSLLAAVLALAALSSAKALAAAAVGFGVCYLLMLALLIWRNLRNG